MLPFGITGYTTTEVNIPKFSLKSLTKRVASTGVPCMKTGVTQVLEFPRLKPLSNNPFCSFSTFSQSLALISGLVLKSSNLFKPPITIGIVNDFAKICERRLNFKYLMISLFPAINAPKPAIDLAKVEKYTSIWSWQPCSSPAPAPVFPKVPKP